MSKLFFANEVSGSGDIVRPLYFPASRLTRHAVCLGMTGSGKTGLCVSLLEEVISSGVPVIALDPKGDLTNLALGFRHHRPEDFLPWVDESKARSKGISSEQMAEELSKSWKKGLKATGVSDEQVAAFTEGGEVTIYTPGSTVGVPVNVLSALNPPAEINGEATADLIRTTTSSLLGLVSVDADPVQDPRHLVLSKIIETAWRSGEHLDLERLIMSILDPSFHKVGVFPLETFFPRKERMELAMKLNGVIASPSFSSWLQGEDLNIERLLSQEGAKTPVSIFSMSHLDEGQRMFFAATLLSQIVAWSRRQPGTSALRALVYFDEVMGFLPPYPHNPPTKQPIMALMKQARAVGVSTMLCTQNPVDVDYKAMSNAGTWLIGRLTTAQDRKKVIDGLAGSAAVDRGELERQISGLPSRTFIMRDVSESGPQTITSRWAISFLRGPLTLGEISKLKKEPEVTASRPGAAPAPVSEEGWNKTPPRTPGAHKTHFLNPEVAFSARFSELLPARNEASADGVIRWRPALYARVALTFDDRDYLLERAEHRLFFPIDDETITVAGEPNFEEGDLLTTPPSGGLFSDLPARIDEERELKDLQKKVLDQIYRGETETMFLHKKLKLRSRAGETLEDFVKRVELAMEEVTDADMLKLKDKIEKQVKRLEAKRQKALSDIDRYEGEKSAKMAAEAVNIGETLFGYFFGGRKKSLNTAMSKREATRKAGERISRSQQIVEDVDSEVYELEVALQEDLRAIEEKNKELARVIDNKPIKLERADLSMDSWGVLWIPVSRPGLTGSLQKGQTL